jgi:hypothetical protein
MCVWEEEEKLDAIHCFIELVLCSTDCQTVPLYRECGVKEETPAHILCECGPWPHSDMHYLGSFFLVPEDIKSISLGAIWGFSKATGLS